MPVPAWEPGIKEVADGVFAYIHAQARWDLCNSGFVVSSDGVMVVDAMMVASMVRPYLEALRKITSKPIRYLVNTHHHLDHCFGNQFFLPTEIISQHSCRETIVTNGVRIDTLQQRYPQYKDDWPRVRLTPPTLTYGEKMVVHLGDRVIELLHPGPAHTYGDTLVYLPKEKLLFTGDVAFHYLTPLAADGHVSRWIRVSQRIIRDMDVSTVVAAHGPVSGKDIVRKTLGYLRLLRRTSRLHFQRGATVEEAARAMDLGEYAHWSEPERALRNVQRMYQELRGELSKPRSRAFR